MTKNKKLNAEQVLKKYKNKYIEVYRTYDYTEQQYFYEVYKSYNKIHENTCLVLGVNFYEEWLS